jgi:hypothetical protein
MYLGYDVCSTIRFFAASPTLFFAQPLHKQVLPSWTKAFRAYYTFELMYYLLAAVSVLPHISLPHEWPPLTGSFRRNAWSIRNMWGKCWHQIARKECCEAGRIVKKICRFRTGSFRSRYSQI